MAASECKAAIRDRIKGALWGMLIGDALSMPVHWYYNPNDIKKQFGTITEYQPASEHHPTSIMSLSNTGGHGRGSNKGNIIGDVILKGKKKWWGPPNVHYHRGMKAGENTLNALCSRLLVRSIVSNTSYNADKFLESYVDFMTTPDTHNDTYAESYHRDFFVNYVKGKPLRECAGPEGHNTASMGGFVMLPPVALAFYNDVNQAKKRSLEHLSLTHTSPSLGRMASTYVELIVKVVNGEPFDSAITEAAKKVDDQIVRLWSKDHSMSDTEVIHSVFGSACYISSSFPSLLYLAGKYKLDIESALIANTNAGGENCHRGSALGALMGAAVGFEKNPKQMDNRSRGPRPD
eukprot:Colp12_sorted_trinity150504_noHs@20957